MSIFVLAQSSDTAAGGAGSFIFPLVLAVGFLLLITLPQRRMRKRQAELQAGLEVGDVVRTVGGIRGTVIEIGDDTATIQIEEGRLVVERRAVSGKIEG